jgi:hypothetical protein
MRIPVQNPPTDVSFDISGYDADRNHLFYRDNIGSVSNVSNSDKVGIVLNPGNIRTITLSGTITVTNNEQSVPRVQIDAWTGSQQSGSYTWLGSTELTTPGTNASWSMTIPAFDTPTDVSFRVYGYDANGNQFFHQENTGTVSGISTTNRAGIVLNPGNIRTVTLSGTITATINNQPVPRVQIFAQSLGEYGSSLGSTELTTPGTNASWSITIPAFDSPTDVRFDVQGSDSNWNKLFSETGFTVTNVSNINVENIAIDMGNYSAVTLSGTVNITVNGQKPKTVHIEAYTDPYNSLAWSSIYGYDTGPNTWSMTVIDPPIQGTTVYFDILYANAGYDYGSVTLTTTSSIPAAGGTQSNIVLSYSTP